MNLTINKLIANDIIDYGMKQTSEFSYTVSLDTYLENYDEKSKNYILENLDEIIDDIGSNEKIADLIVDENNGTKDIDMVFYWGHLITPFEKKICQNAECLDVALAFEDIKDIESEILDDENFNKNLDSKIEFYGNERSL